MIKKSCIAVLLLSHYVPALAGDTVPEMTQACDKGDAEVCFDLGVMYDYAKGISEDKPQAVLLYTKSCDANYAQACSNLGLMYANGEGVSKDRKKAAKLYTQACDQGDVMGCYNLGLINKAAGRAR